MAKRKSHPLFSPIKKEIEAARDQLRKQRAAASSPAVEKSIHALFLKLEDTFKCLGFGALANIKPAAAAKAGKRGAKKAR